MTVDMFLFESVMSERDGNDTGIGDVDVFVVGSFSFDLDMGDDDVGRDAKWQEARNHDYREDGERLYVHKNHTVSSWPVYHACTMRNNFLMAVSVIQ